MSGHELFEELAAGHALDALEPQDEQVFLQHVAGCALCERELDVHRATAAQLADGAGPGDVPEGMLARLREAVVAESGPEVFSRPTVRVAAPATVTRLRHLRRPSVALLAAAASAVLVIALTGSNLAMRHARLQQTAASDGLVQAVKTLGEAPGRSVPLVDGERNVAAIAVVQGDHVSLVIRGMAPNRDSTTYVLWEQTRSGVRSLRAFDVHDTGVEVLRDLPLRTGVGPATGFAISREKGKVAPPQPRVGPLASGAVEDA